MVQGMVNVAVVFPANDDVTYFTVHIIKGQFKVSQWTPVDPAHPQQVPPKCSLVDLLIPKYPKLHSGGP